MVTTQLDRAPDLTTLYLKSALPSRRRAGELPDTELALDVVAVDRNHLAAYNRVCGYRLRDTLPVTYPHIVAFPLSISLMAEPTFPFALPGLVHVANSIEQRRPIRTTEQLSFRVRTADLRPHRKGQQFDVVCMAEANGEPVWIERSTYLKRGGGNERSPQAATPPASSVLGTVQGAAPSAVWRIPADIGRRYAAVSGDRNPIHLHPLSARLFGFPRAIAHGMWTKAHCLAALEGRLKPALTVEVVFAKPVLLPATAAFDQVADGEGIRFSVRDERRDTPHLDGRITQ